MASSSESIDGGIEAQPSSARRTLAIAGFAHALHDGYTDLIYVLLPVWQTEFALGYGALALLRGLYAGAMAGLQIPAGRLAEFCGGRIVLALGTALAGVGYAVAGLSGGLVSPPDTNTGLTFVTKANVGQYLSTTSRFEGSSTAQKLISRSGAIA